MYTDSEYMYMLVPHSHIPVIFSDPYSFLVMRVILVIPSHALSSLLIFGHPSYP